MRHVGHLISKASGVRCPVLIQGETGTGKGVVAREIHAVGPWSDQPFVTIDCAALPPALIEDELFGHARGAFTGAHQARPGLLTAVGAGTAFFDEIGELAIELQPKLLRCIDERAFRPIGSNEEARLQARILAATSRNLEAAVEHRTFRGELFFRLNVIPIVVPPLREHKVDIPDLIQVFLQRHSCSAWGEGTISQDALNELIRYDWPGNVRELENAIQYALAMAMGSEINPEDLPPQLPHGFAALPEVGQATTLRELERRAILTALEATGGNPMLAARLLGIGKTTIYRKLREYAFHHADSHSGDKQPRLPFSDDLVKPAPTFCPPARRARERAEPWH